MRLAGALVAMGLTAVAAATAGEPPVSREGAWWVQVHTGTVAVPGSSLRVHMRGPVTVEGVAGVAAAEWTLRKRVRASSESEARRLLGELVLRAGSASGSGTLTLAWPDRPLASAELEIRVPPSLRGTIIETHSGDVQISGIDGQVQAKSGAGIISMDRIRGDAAARTAGGDIKLGRMGGRVNCFSGGGAIQVVSTGGESWFETAGGEINIGSGGGPVHASTAGGNIHIGRAMSSVAVRTAGGRIEVQEARGIVVAGNSGGSIQIGAAQGVRLEATGGSIRLRGSSGALRAVSDVGSIQAELHGGLRLQDSVFSTGAGDITVFIPSDIAVTIQALNESGRLGRIVSEFPEIAVRRLVEESNAGVSAEGTLNGGGPVLKLTSAGGTIYLRRTPK
jgi:hypothetical protein